VRYGLPSDLVVNHWGCEVRTDTKGVGQGTASAEPEDCNHLGRSRPSGEVMGHLGRSVERSYDKGDYDCQCEEATSHRA